MRPHPRNPGAGQRGSILIWVALFVLVMIAFVALAVDGAKLMATRTQLQNAADAGALAGVSEIDYATGLIDQAAATTTAQATAASNKAFIEGPSPVLDAVVSFPQPDQCQVDVTRSGPTAIVTHLAQVVGVTTLDAGATAIAEASSPGCVYGLRPLGVAADTMPFDYVVGQEYCLLREFTSSSYQYLDFANIEPPLDPACELGPCALTNEGADMVLCCFEYGFGCCVSIGMYVKVQTGVIAAIDKVVDAVFERDVVQTEYGETQTDSYPVYLAAGGNGSRVIVVPLVKFVQSPTDWTRCAPGTNCYGRVDGFAAFFLKRTYNPGVKDYCGEFIRYVVMGEGAGGESTVSSIRLVK